jgi:hypothetical protein
MTDTILKSKAMEVLVQSIGVLETERFITLILKEPFDYTKWRMDNLSSDITVDELNKQAVEYWNSLQPKTN